MVNPIPAALLALGLLSSAPASAYTYYTPPSADASVGLCRNPDTARFLIEQYNLLDWPGYPRRQVVDIEHLRTVEKDPGKLLICQGTWVHTNGRRIEGTMTVYTNVAGDIIVSWKPGRWHPNPLGTP